MRHRRGTLLAREASSRRHAGGLGLSTGLYALEGRSLGEIATARSLSAVDLVVTLLQLAGGVRAVLINGVVAFDAGAPTNVRTGRLVCPDR